MNHIFRAAVGAALLLCPLAQAQTIDLDAALTAARAEVDRPGFSGSVVVLQGGVPIFAEARGEADQANSVPNTLDTRFNIASVGKFLTAIGYVRAATENGIDDFAAAHPADLLDPEDTLVTPDLTMGDLMAHATTAADLYEAENSEVRLGAARNNADIFQLMRDAQSAPIDRLEEDLAYRNSNAIITGEIIARLTGQSYEAAMQRLVFEPADIQNAVFARQDQAGELGLAIPYLPEGFDMEQDMRPRPGQPVPAVYPVHAISPLTDSISMAAGGLYISALELAGLGAATLDGTLLTRDQLTALCTSQVAMPGLVFGLGCGGRVHGPAQRRWGHNGGAPGVNAELAIFPDQNIVLAVVSNHQMRATPVLDAFERALFALPDPETGNGFVIRG